MILTSLAIAGGVLTIGVKVYREHKRKKESPWTVAAERMGIYPKIARKQEHTLVRTGKAALSKLKEQQTRLFAPDTRQQQLAALSSGSEESEISIEEQELNRLLAISAGCFAVAIGGLWLPALNIILVPGTLYLLRPWVSRTYQLIIKEKRVGLAMVDMIWIGTALVTGHYVAMNMLFCFIFFAEKLLMKTEDRSMNNLINIFSEQPRSIWVVVDGMEIEVPFESIKVGDTVVIQAGQTIAVDGMITSGYATIDQRTLTGESQPVEKGVGEQVFASTVVLSGQVYVQVEKAGSETIAAQIGDILSNTASFQSGMRAIGQRIAEKGAFPTLGFGTLAWFTLGSSGTLSVLNAGIGYTLRAAAPIAMLNLLRIASQEGILIKDGRSLELLGQVDTIVFDKTGTLTEEVPTVGQIYAHRNSEEELLRYTAAAEYKQTHPIAKAILKEASHRKLSLPNIAEARYEVGYGLTVSVEERSVIVSSARFMEMSGIVIPPAYQNIQEASHAEGNSLVYVAIDAQFAGAIELCPTIRPEARELVRQLQQKKMSTVIISGDNEKPTQKLAQTLGIDRYFAETLPEDKANLIEQLQAEGKTVCFVGDGINDSIAMKKAQVSISLNGASTVATDTAGIILMDGTLSQLVPLFDIGQEFKTTLERGIVMSVLPGIVSIGGVFFLHWGIITTILLYQLNLGCNILNSMSPLLAYQRKKADNRLPQRPH
jgi:Cu2+-exporting ATPase